MPSLTRRTPNLALAVLVMVSIHGCRKEDNEPEIRSVEGVIESLDLTNSRITMRFYNERHKQYITVTGQATPDTEIEINGVIATLKDLRTGERITAEGLVRGKGQNLEVIARRITVQRAETIRRQTADTTEKPAGKADASPDP
ncbi:MAG: hypothetical protein ACE5GE_14110 [Phycisphaerae bacterium]